jgi:hypothetical protein
MKKIILLLFVSLFLGCEKKIIESEPVGKVTPSESQIQIDRIILLK